MFCVHHMPVMKAKEDLKVTGGLPPSEFRKVETHNNSRLSAIPS